MSRLFRPSRLLAGALALCLGSLLAVPAAAQLSPLPGAPALSAVTFNWTEDSNSYNVQLSTASDFSAIAFGGAVLTNETTTYQNLSQDTIYYFRVKNAAAGSYTAANSTMSVTLAAAPSGIFFQQGDNFFNAESSVTAQVNIGWATNGNPDYTSYVLEYTSNTNFASYKYETTVIYPPISLGGLLANTTYQFRVKASNLANAETGTVQTSTSTLAASLEDLAYTAYRTSATVSWVPMAVGARERSAEGYALLVSSSPIFEGLVHSSRTALPPIGSLTVTGILTNTTYYYKAGAVNWNGAANFSDVDTFTTMASPLSAFALASRDISEATLSWTALGSGAAGYELQASSDDFAGAATVISSRTYDLADNALTVDGLEANTTWYFRAGSLNSGGGLNYTTVLSTITKANAVPLNTQINPSVATGKTDLTVYFSPLPLSPQSAACERYLLERSTGPFGSGSLVISSEAPTDNTGVIGFAGLRPSTTYYLRLSSLNWDRSPTVTDIGYVATEPTDPLASVTLYGVWSTSATVTFGAVGSDGYVLQAAPDLSFSSIEMEGTTSNGAATSVTVNGLDPNRIYYFRAGPVFSGTTVYTVATPSYDYTLPPRPSGVAHGGVFYSSISVTWTALPAAPPDQTADGGYLLEASQSPSFASVDFSSRAAVITTSALALTGLAPNTSYYLRLGSLAFDGGANYTFLVSTPTRAIPPTQQSYTGLSTGTLRVNWTAGANPADTLYSVEISSYYPAFSFSRSSYTYNQSSYFSGLNPNTTFYSRVTAFNRRGIAEGPYEFTAMATLAFDPVSAAPSVIGQSSVTVNWSRGLNPASPPNATEYTVRISTVQDLSSAVHSSTTRNTSAWFDGLLSNASYYSNVSALNHTGVGTDAITLPAPLTLPSAPMALAKAQAFSGMLLDGFTLNWQHGNNQDWTAYGVEVSTKDDFDPMYSSGTAAGLSFDFSGLLVDTTYFARIRAISRNGVFVSSFSESGSTRTLADQNRTAPYGEDTVVTLPSSYGDYSVIVPAGGLGGSTRITIAPETLLPSAPGSAGTLIPTGIGMEVTHFPPVVVLGGITLAVPYIESALPPGTDERSLILALYDTVNDRWVPLNSTPDTTANIVRAQTWHLSTFQIMISQPAAGIDGLKIYPNPYRPSSVAGLVRFANLPADTEIKIYTLVGEFIKDFTTGPDGTGSWDGKNEKGSEVASGVYLAFVKPPGGKGKVFKLAVER